ncbi:cytochrome p450 [Trichoderma arundinaceum]|uniref:Cytochrome p450 n=1 Tax=Trichoderma arundinaceum TaxID=490622 RepID=A0A395NQJ1_TRIAR|nr:cytochrome p450 [Trichoderma arundinaceum]
MTELLARVKEALPGVLTWQLIAAAVVYLVLVPIYRLTLHPLARFPGPKIAAVTRYYEAYYDLVLKGQYTWKIEQLHKQYGPIIRISPYELHVDDPTFFEQLYRHDGRWDKYAWATNGFGAPGATIYTSDHYLHKARRSVVNPFFSKAKVAKRQDDLRRHIVKLCNRLSGFAKSKEIVNLGAAITALTRDIINDFIFYKAYNCLDHEDFDVITTNAGQNFGFMWRVGKHIPWFTPLLKSIPHSLIMKFTDESMHKFFDNLYETMNDIKELMTSADSSNPDPNAPRTIINAILESKLSPADKEFDRVFEEVSMMAGAGFETTAGALRLILFHVYSNPEILKKLRAELLAAGLSLPDNLELKSLEQLPYITAVIMEGMRLFPAVATRMAHVAPDRDIFYNEWRIPEGTPVGMTLILMHTDERMFQDPQTFQPERWTDPENRKRVEKAYAPFSKGTRICLGMHVAWADIYLVLAALVLKFDFDYQGATAADFEVASDEFAIGTRGKGVLNAIVTSVDG